MKYGIEMPSQKIQPQINIRPAILISCLAVLMFSPMFVLRQVGPIDFWWWMTINLSVLITLAMVTDWEYYCILSRDFTSGIWKKAAIGLLSALILYFVFFLGNYLSRLWFDFASPGIENVYKFKGDAAGIRIAILMLLIIGPGEELFWRGYLQRKFSKKYGKWTGLIIALVLYTGVHIFTGNFMLIMAAFICGLFWAWMYLKYESMLINVISHTVWDIVVFLVLPFH
ncbi:MAG: type II CAAX endopeptidase family protein [Bacteroidales bacterium]|jgi:membrane protease YdiL (CAAX protease family)|nr:type II CAAX endopeptidase family protein [Bacteroidales bacterium]